MREWVENTCIWLGGEIPANLQTELTNAAFDAVDWDEVVAHLEPESIA